jgi:hypothetical protein
MRPNCPARRCTDVETHRYTPRAPGMLRGPWFLVVLREERDGGPLQRYARRVGGLKVAGGPWRGCFVWLEQNWPGLSDRSRQRSRKTVDSARETYQKAYMYSWCMQRPRGMHSPPTPDHTLIQQNALGALPPPLPAAGHPSSHLPVQHQHQQHCSLQPIQHDNQARPHGASQRAPCATHPRRCWLAENV